jgi:hypothetical protein
MFYEQPVDCLDLHVGPFIRLGMVPIARDGGRSCTLTKRRGHDSLPEYNRLKQGIGG